MSAVPTESEVALARSILSMVPPSPAPKGSPDYDHWGILNWARQQNIQLFESVPGARRAMIRSAAVDRWLAHYRNQNSVEEFLAYAEWLSDNLALTTKGADKWKFVGESS